MTTSKKGLGKGLGALFTDVAPVEGDQVRQVPITSISPNPFQARTRFDEEKLAELAASISAHGVIQPLLVREVEPNRYELVAGERRWRAAKMAGLTNVPVVIRTFDDVQMHEVALIENLQREDLNPIEEALAYRALMDQIHLTQEELSKRIGKSRSAIANTLRLLQLDKSLQTMVQDGRLSEGHARALLSLPKQEQAKVAMQVVDQGLTVRQTEKLVQKFMHAKLQDSSKKLDKQKEDPFVTDLERRLEYILGAPVQLRHQSKKGVIQIEYYGLEDLERLVELLSGQRATS